jgi:hypothetical protein
VVFNTYSCTLAETAIIPNAGISDVDPTNWVGTGGVTALDAQALTASPVLTVPFAVIVNLALRNALQAAEGLTSGSEALSDVPYITSIQLRTILSGDIFTLADLYEFNPTTKQTAQIDPTGSIVHICGGGDTSSSKLVTNIYFFGRGCLKGSGVGSLATPDDPTTQASGETWTGNATQLFDFVFAGSSTSDITSCVAAGLGAGDTFNARIGYVSTNQASKGTNWRYIALDGVAPTIWNIQLERYGWLFEDRFNSTNASLAQNGGLGNHALIFNLLQTTLSAVDGIAGVNVATLNSAASSDTTGAADAGLVTLFNMNLFGPSNPSGPSAPAWPAAIRAIATAGRGPNNPQLRTYPGQSPNICNPTFQGVP